MSEPLTGTRGASGRTGRRVPREDPPAGRAPRAPRIAVHRSSAPLVSGPVIVRLNGTHGAGRTTTSALAQQSIPCSRVFDAEKVGETLMDVTPGLPGTDDVQHWPPWRPLVVETAHRILDDTGGTPVMPRTVLVEQYWREISTRLSSTPSRSGTSSSTLTRTRSAGASRGTSFSTPPFSVSGTSSPAPRRPAPGCTTRPRSSTPHTSRPPRPPCRSQVPSTVESSLHGLRARRWFMTLDRPSADPVVPQGRTRCGDVRGPRRRESPCPGGDRPPGRLSPSRDGVRGRVRLGVRFRRASSVDAGEGRPGR